MLDSASLALNDGQNEIGYLLTLWQLKNRWAWPCDLNFRICRSCCRVG